MARPRAPKASERTTCKDCGQVHERCVGHRREDGRPCGNHPMHGGQVCRMHGGSAPQTKAAAARRLADDEARRAVATYGLPVDIDPGDALLEEVRWTAGHVLWLRAAVQELEAKPLTEGGAFGGPHALLVLYRDERRHLVAVAAAALKAGIEERRVRLAEQQGELIAGVIRQLLDDPELGLNPDQRERGRAIASRHLRVLASA